MLLRERSATSLSSSSTWPLDPRLDPARLHVLSPHQHRGNLHHCSAATHILKADHDLKSFAGSNQNIWQCTGLSHLGTTHFGKPSYLLITFMAALPVKCIARVVSLNFALHSALPIAGSMPFCLSSPTNIPSKWQRQRNDEQNNLQTLGQIRARLKCKSWILGLPLTAYLWVKWVRKTSWPPGLNPRWALISSSLFIPGFKENLPLIHLHFC